MGVKIVEAETTLGIPYKKPGVRSRFVMMRMEAEKMRFSVSYAA